jgi:phenylalanyl-tRNA synthetase beta chain
MICSERELGISDDHSGILVLDEAAVPGTPIGDFLDYHDFILDFELTPNRADSMSAIGIARDLAALAKTKVIYPSFELKTTGENVGDLIKVTSEDLQACPRFTARVIRNVKIGPSPWWVQKKLIGAGMRPISNIVDVTNLVMLETGNPIHAFDYDRFDSNEVVVRRATEGEKLKTLDGQEHALSPDVLLVTDGKRARAAAGVMGGFDSEVTDDTRNILLEVAYFDPSVIRKSRKKMGMVSEASNRFEKGVDPNNVSHASSRASSLFHELCGGEVLDGLVDFYPEPIEPVKVTLRPSRCNDILGVEIPAERMIEILRLLEFELTGDDPIEVTVPTFRPDITREIDLIEEVARIEGYDAIPDATENIGPLFAPQNRQELTEQQIRTVLTGVGFDEILGHGLADSKQARLLNADLPEVRILNPVSEDLDIMRNDLAQTALTSIAHNLAHRNLDLKLFEIGKVYCPPDAEGRWVEEDRISVAVTGHTLRSWRDKPRPSDFYDIRGALYLLGRHFNWPRLEFGPVEVTYMEPGESYALKLDGQSVGWIGLVHPKVARKFEIKQPVYLLQLKIQPLMEKTLGPVEFQPLPVYPAVTRDLAMVVSESTQAGRLLDTVRTIGGDLAESVELFDLYTGKQIGEGKKSVAVAMTFRSPDRSLSNAEVDKLLEKTVAKLKQDFNAEVRDW